MRIQRCAYALLLLAANGAACELPALPLIPATTGDDAAQVLVEVRRYSDALVAYTDCLKAELAAAGGDAAPASFRSVLVARNNSAAAEHKAVTELYAQRVGPLENLRLADYLEGEGRDCLVGSSVVGTGIVNDGAVIFFLRNEQAYLNVLEAACPGLERDGEFMVGEQAATGVGMSPMGRNATLDTPLSARVCDQDRIFPYREGSSRRVLGCGLGRFFPVAEEQALQILAALGGSPPPAEDGAVERE